MKKRVPSATNKDCSILDHIDFEGKNILLVNSRSYLNLPELEKRGSDAMLVFIEDVKNKRDSAETNRDTVETDGNSVETDSKAIEISGNSMETRGDSKTGVEDSMGQGFGEMTTCRDSIHYLDTKNQSIDSLGLEKESFDYIVFKNSLETLYDPWTWLKDVCSYLKLDGKVLVEIANIRNMNVFSSIVNGYFTYSDDGIISFDKLRFFTPAELSVQAVNAGYGIIDVHHSIDASLENRPQVLPGRIYNSQGDNFVLNNVPGESLLEMYSDRSLVTLKKQCADSSFISPLYLQKPADYFENPRLDLIDMMDGAPEAVLEIGCGIGTTCKAIKDRYPSCHTVGIDIDEKSIRKASAIIDRAIGADIEKTGLSELGIGKETFDYIIYGDVLEHLENPWEVLRKHKGYLRRDGKILASIPNVRHSSVLVSLLYGRWTYAPAGILDVTHLRFFTLREIKRSFEAAGFYIYDIKGNPDLKPEDLKLSRDFSHFSFDIQDLRLQNIPREEVPEFWIIQFLVKAGKATGIR
ncbi:MAG: class I SAM-dependent methyltransferase [Nitrospirota bacterium]